MDTTYADALNELNDAISRACALVDGILSREEIAKELRAIADQVEKGEF
jgi:hypothetical protein